MTKTKDPIALLKSDHKEVKKLFDKFEEADSEDKNIIAQEAIKELKIHSAIEEEIFYPAVKKNLKDDEIVIESKEEHRVAKTLIEALEGMDAQDEDFTAKFTVLAENIRHHIKEEENEMFKMVRKTDLDLNELGEQMTARKEELMSNEAKLKEAEQRSKVKPYQEMAAGR